MRFLRFIWKLFVMASVFGIGYVVGREHSFEEEELWNEENEKLEEKSEDAQKSDTEKNDGIEKAIEFSIENAEAVKVSIVGNFNEWNKNVNSLTKDAKNANLWKTTINLKPGRYEYQFVINDTDWVVDPKAENAVKNKFEGMNSVIEIK